MADRLGLQEADWAWLADTYGDAVAPFAGLAPANDRTYAGWQHQVAVEALGHVGTLQELATFKLPFLLIKGLAWGTQFWGSVTARSAHDLDLVVAQEDADAWQNRLAVSGFLQAESPLVWRRGRQHVQLHGLANAPHWLNRIQPPWPAFWDRSSFQLIDHLNVRQLDPADTLLYLAHHQVFRHAFDHDYGWIDLAGWLRRFPADTVDLAWQRAGHSHLQQALAALGWAWRHHWNMPGLDLPDPYPWVRPWLHLALCHPQTLAGPAFSLSLASRTERQTLLVGVPDAWRRWRKWHHITPPPT
jgi:hypothetical protein